MTAIRMQTGYSKSVQKRTNALDTLFGLLKIMSLLGMPLTSGGALSFVMGLIVLRFRNIENLTPETKLLIDLLRRISTNEKDGISKG